MRRDGTIHPLIGGLVVASVVGAAVGGLVYCGRSEAPELLVDNTSGEALRVSIDGAEAVSVAAGAVSRIALAPGIHQLRFGPDLDRRMFEILPRSPESFVLHIGSAGSWLFHATYGEEGDEPSIFGSTAMRLEEPLSAAGTRHVDGVDARIPCTESASVVSRTFLCHEGVDGTPRCTCDPACADVCREAFGTP